jgi:hypothetical protein
MPEERRRDRAAHCGRNRRLRVLVALTHRIQAIDAFFVPSLLISENRKIFLGENGRSIGGLGHFPS